MEWVRKIDCIDVPVNDVATKLKLLVLLYSIRRSRRKQIIEGFQQNYFQRKVLCVRQFVI